MDHFNITQECIFCLKGSRVFRVDLSDYDANGRRIILAKDMGRFRFICHLCGKETTLDFYRFSHPSLICYLKRLHDQFKETKKTLDKLYILFNNINK